MARAALPGRLTWQLARVVEVTPENGRTKTIVLEAPDWGGHRAGQHVDVRLTAEDGYQAQRSYSIASAPEDEQLMLTVEEIADGEVSPYLTEELRPGDELELRGPIGGWFVWDGTEDGPLLLFGGGSGVVPLRAMLRHRAATSNPTPARLVYSARSLEDVIYRDELQNADAGVDLHLALTRSWPEDWTGHRGRINDAAAERGRLAAERRAGDLRLRADRVRRGDQPPDGRARARARAHQDRAIRTHERIGLT